MTDDILDDLFHACSLAAYLQQAQIQQGWPDSEATRQPCIRLLRGGTQDEEPR